MENKKIGGCVIGAGRAGMIHARNFARGVPNARLVAMVDPFEEAAQMALNT
jgi:myo-inositol 2-dehydrogenase/D-chiro-inositol 1-dehydrogenase/scyllo-inositol 2-dehydrogenase (NAD+)